MSQITLQVQGMSCQHCVKSVEEAVREVGATGTVNLKAASVDVTFDEQQVSLEQIKHAIEEQGYEVGAAN